MRDSDRTGNDGPRPTRRRVLALTAVGATGFAGLATAQDGQGPDQQPQGSDQPAETFQLGGEVSAWQGEQPQAIQGQSNPPLSVQPGQLYELTWENLDGQPHNFAFRDEQGNDLAVILPAEDGAGNATAANATDGQPAQAGQTGNRTGAPAQNDTGGGAGDTGDSGIQIRPGDDSLEDPLIGGPGRGNQTGNQTGAESAGGTTDNQTGASTGNQTGNATTEGGVQLPENAISTTETVREQGATQTVRFVATQEMATYICPIHPTTMEGPVQIQQGGQEEEGDPGTGGRPEPQPQE